MPGALDPCQRMLGLPPPLLPSSSGNQDVSAIDVERLQACSRGPRRPCTENERNQ
jgi:hypothetical protein